MRLDLALRNLDVRGRTEFVGESVQGDNGVFLRPGKHMSLGVGRGKQTGFARVSEESRRGFGADEHDMTDTLEHAHRLFDRVRDAIDRNPASAAGHAGDLGGCFQHGAARVRHALRGHQTFFAGRLTRHHDHRAFALAQRQCDVANRVRRDFGTLGGGQRAGNLSPVAPRRVGRQDQGGNLSGRRHRRLHRGGAVGTDAFRRSAAAHPVRHGPGKPFSVVSQRRIERTVPGCMITDDVHHRRIGAPRIVDIGSAVGESGPAMHQRCGRLSRHARITVGASGDHRLCQSEHATHAGNLVERRDKMHFRRTGVGKTGIDAAREKRAYKALRPIHDNMAPHALSKPRTLTHGNAPFGVDAFSWTLSDGAHEDR